MDHTILRLLPFFRDDRDDNFWVLLGEANKKAAGLPFFLAEKSFGQNAGRWKKV